MKQDPQSIRVLGVELAAARKLARKLQKVLRKDMPKFESDGFEFAIGFALLLRAERTFLSIRTLARMRMVDDAFALVRVMVEKVINAEYILLVGMSAAEDYIQFAAFREWRDLEDLRGVAPSLVPKYTEEQLSRMRTTHDRAKMKMLPDGSQRPRFGRGNDWTDVGLAKRAEVVDEMLCNKFSMRASSTARILYHSTYKKSASYLHGMWAALVRSFEHDEQNDTDDTEDDNGMVNIRIGIRMKDEDPRVAVHAVNTANLCAVAMILFLGKFYKKEDYLKWVFEFKEKYLGDLRQAKTAL